MPVKPTNRDHEMSGPFANRADAFSGVERFDPFGPLSGELALTSVRAEAHTEARGIRVPK
jgi:hypothetical protein